MNRGPLKATDGFASLQGGMNGGVLNTAIPFNQCAKGINVTCRNGVLGTRPRVVEVDVVMKLLGCVEAPGVAENGASIGSFCDLLLVDSWRRLHELYIAHLTTETCHHAARSNTRADFGTVSMPETRVSSRYLCWLKSMSKSSNEVS